MKPKKNFDLFTLSNSRHGDKFLPIVKQVSTFLIKPPILLFWTMLLAFILIFGFKFLIGTSDYTGETSNAIDFSDQKQVDPIVSMTGINYYLQEKWHFPLLITKNASIPDGHSVLYHSSIPLMALAFKLVATITTLKINYYGIWVFLCWFLIALFSYKILHYFFPNQSYLTLVGALSMAVFLPIAQKIRGTEEYGLTAVLNVLPDFLILMAFYYALLTEKKPQKAYLYFSITVLLAFLIDLYFIAMILPLYFFIGLRLLVKSKNKYYVYLFSATGFLCFILLFILGYVLLNRTSPSTLGYGGAHRTLVQLITLKQIPLSFTILLGICAIRILYLKARGLRLWNDVAPNVKQYKISIIIILSSCLLLLLQVLTNKVHLSDGNLLFEYSLPSVLDKIAHTFRATQRFFWPWKYFFMLSTVVLCLSVFPKRLAFALIVGITLLYPLPKVVAKIQDNQKMFSVPAVEGEMRTALEAKTQFKRDFWRTLLNDIDTIYFYPTYMNNDWNYIFFNPNFKRLQVSLPFLASLRNIPINGCLIARNWHGQIKEHHNFFNTYLKPDEANKNLYLYNERYFQWMRYFSAIDVKKHFKKIHFPAGENSTAVYVGIQNFLHLNTLNKKFNDYLSDINLATDGIAPVITLPSHHSFLVNKDGSNKQDITRNVYQAHFDSPYTSLNSKGLEVRHDLYGAFTFLKGRSPNRLQIKYSYPKKIIPNTRRWKLKKKLAYFANANTLFFPSFFKKVFAKQIDFFSLKNEAKIIDVYVNGKLLKTLTLPQEETTRTVVIALDKITTTIQATKEFTLKLDIQNEKSFEMFIEKISLL